MAHLTISIPHQLTRDEAKSRVVDLVADLHQKSGGMLGPIDTQWQEFVLSYRLLPMGQPVSGQIVVEERSVRVDVELPWFLAAIAGSVRSQIEERGQRLLACR